MTPEPAIDVEAFKKFEREGYSRVAQGSTRQKDLADIARLLEAYPALRERVPAEILARLL